MMFCRVWSSTDLKYPEPWTILMCGLWISEARTWWQLNGPNHTDVLIAETLVLPDSEAHNSRGSKVILHRHHLLSNNSTWLSFPIQYFDNFAHWRFSVKEASLALLQYYRLVSTIQYPGHLIISQTGFENDHYYHWFCNNRELDVSFSLEIQYLATFGRYLGGADFYSSKVIIW